MSTSTTGQIYPLNRDQSAELVRLSTAAVAAAGIAVTWDGGHTLETTDEGGPVLGLSNLARTLASQDKKDWPGLVVEHFAVVLEQLRQGAPAAPADPERQLIQRLIPRAALPADWTADRPDFVPGLVSVPSVVSESSVTMYLDPPAGLGLTWSAAEGFGLANLRGLTCDVEYIDHDDMRVAVVTGSPSAASKALTLDDVLENCLNVDASKYGVLAALPARDALMIHVIEDLTVIPALGFLLGAATRYFHAAPSPFTPDVYRVTPDQTWHPATATRPGRATQLLSAHMADLVQEIAAREAMNAAWRE
ncbi:hypothetical protein [Kribbella sp. NPDC048928]|uniref:hypothetical protein n=1 Tax=Kribbella sp. NPDC048928 TaxID=3364111 RepID=UPI00370FDDD8